MSRRPIASRRAPPAARARAQRAPLRTRAGALWLAAMVGACSDEARQPIAYNHRVHVETLALDCEKCHETARTGELAGLPPLSTCAECHSEPNGASAEEAKVVEAVRGAREIPWVTLHELPRDVFFTHRRHVAVAGIACAQCHGAMASLTRPPPGPLVPVAMDACLDCHRERGASRDCAACHR